MATVSVGNFTGVLVRIAPSTFGTFAPSAVTSLEQAGDVVRLRPRDVSLDDCLQVVSPLRMAS
jgi:hypothetical protein